jgi:hypothetical protein
MGNRTAGIVLAALLQAGQLPLLPFGDGYPYGLASARAGCVELRGVDVLDPAGDGAAQGR